MSSVVDVILLEQKTFHYEPGDSLFQTRDWGDEWRKAKIFLFVLEKKKKKKKKIPFCVFLEWLDLLFLCAVRRAVLTNLLPRSWAIFSYHVCMGVVKFLCTKIIWPQLVGAEKRGKARKIFWPKKPSHTTTVSALSRWERQLMLLCRYLLKSWYSFFLILSTRLDTDTFPPPLFVLSLCSTAWPWSPLLFLFGYVEKGSRNTKRFVSVFSFFMTQTVIWKVCCFHRLENLLVSLDSWALELLGGIWFIRWRVIFSCKSDKTVGA